MAIERIANKNGSVSEFGSTVVAPTLQAHYTISNEILDLMVELLGDVTGKKIIEPACGNGAFIQRLLGRALRVDAVDVDSLALVETSKINSQTIRIIHEDFIDYFVRNKEKNNAIISSNYDGAIANPPYGLRLSQSYRQEIKRRFPNLYARESYSLFLYLTLKQLRSGGRYVFLLPDTFLHSYYHRPTRRFLLEFGAPSDIIQFSSSRFESVQYGYGNMCIIAGNADAADRMQNVRWTFASGNSSSLIECRHNIELTHIVKIEELLKSAEDGWVHPSLKPDFEFATSTLGAIAECRTGIYTGDNNQFIGFDKNQCDSRRVGQPIDWKVDVVARTLTSDEVQNGIASTPNFVPLIKGGHRPPLEKTSWAINWSIKAVDFYRSNKKARLQNEKYYFRCGLAVPMVTSGRISASIMFGNAIFDQGVVGVFPKDNRLIAPLLIYLNSSEVDRKLKMSISGSANMSANYIKRIPIPNLTSDIVEEANKILAEALQQGWEETSQRRRVLVQRMLGITTLNIQ